MKRSAAHEVESSAHKRKAGVGKESPVLSVFPSLIKQPTDTSVSISMRMPSVLAQQLETACKTYGVSQSELVRDFISAGLKELEKAGGPLSQTKKNVAASDQLLSQNPFEELAGTWTFGPADDYINELREGWD